MFVASVSYSQKYTFKIDTAQFFRYPSNLDWNSALKYNKIEYSDLRQIGNYVWVIDLDKKTIKVGNGKEIKIIFSDNSPNERWVFIEFLDEKFSVWKLTIFYTKITNEPFMLVTTLTDDIKIQRGYYAHPINLKVN